MSQTEYWFSLLWFSFGTLLEPFRAFDFETGNTFNSCQD